MQLSFCQKTILGFNIKNNNKNSKLNKKVRNNCAYLVRSIVDDVTNA